MKFNIAKAGHAFLGVKAGRIIGDFLKPWPESKLLYCINNHKFITDYIPASFRLDLKAKFNPHRDMLDGFTNEEVYRWIPQNYRQYFERTPGGKDWVLAELQHIREFLTS